MSTISALIEKLEKEDELRQQEYALHFAEQEKKYKELKERIDFCKDEHEKQMENITKGLDKLIANKHTIEKSLEQTENIYGLPIPYNQHGVIVDLVSKITEFVNNTSDLNNSNTFSISKIHEDVVSVSESIESDLKEYRIDLSEAQSLHYNTKMLKRLMLMDDNDESKEVMMDGSFSLFTEE